MKYIIEFEDEPSMVEAGLRYYQCKQVPYWSISHGIIKNLTPYNEPSQKAIDLQHAHDIENVARMNYSKGAEDAWEFVRTVTDMTEAQRIQCFGGATCDLDEYYTYQEAKAKYEAWKKKEEEIRVGDEVIQLGTQHDTMVVTKLWTGEYRDEWADTIASDGKLFSFLKTSIKKTGRHFNEVEELLKKMKGEQNDT